MKQSIIDLSYPLDTATPPFPGDLPVELSIQAAIPADHPPGTPGAMNVSRFATGVHVGTHMDAPFHFYREGQTIDQIALERCTGRALLIDLAHKQAKEAITADDLLPHQEAIRQTRKVILNTGWATHWQQTDYFTDFPALTADAAQFLLACGVELVGVDTPSVDTYPYPVHFALLGNQVLIVENLTNLDRIGQRLFHFTALPLKLTGRDASPVRAIAILSND
jgi:kynurenine formamidase